MYIEFNDNLSFFGVCEVLGIKEDSLDREYLQDMLEAYHKYKMTKNESRLKTTDN